MAKSLKTNIQDQRDTIAAMMRDPLAEVAQQSLELWNQRELLDNMLLEEIPGIPHAKFLYALGPNAIQVSSNISATGLDESDFIRDRSQRPYMQNLNEDDSFTLSEAYISLRERRPSITAIQKIKDGEHLLGYLGADFDLRDLPFSHSIYEEPDNWRQLKGDPAIRGSLFSQTRTDSVLDKHIDTVTAVLEELFVERGLFHGKIHFASSRATAWVYDDPYRYRLLDIEALIDPDICMAFPLRSFPENAITQPHEIRKVIDGLRALRYMDDTLYLRAGSLNIMNGMVGLTFSCDGSHYMSVKEFLDKDIGFWEGTTNEMDSFCT